LVAAAIGFVGFVVIAAFGKYGASWRRFGVTAEFALFSASQAA
jgi:hypothetical protein